MTVTLINATRRMKVANLPHDVYCAASGRCACTDAGGRRLASSLTLAAHSAAEGIDEAALSVPDIARDVRAGEIRVKRETASPEPNQRKGARRARKKAR